jgi:hypothetical protein
MINIAAFAAQYVWFEEHTMRVVEVDGVYTEPKEAEMLYITAAQRVSVLITTKNDTTANYAFMGSMDEDLFDKVPSGLNPNVTGWLVYDSSLSLPAAKPVDAFNPLDDITLVPVDGELLLPEPNHVITLEVMMDNLGDGANYAFLNDITYVKPKVPTLYSTLTTGEDAANPLIYGVNTHALVLEHLEVVEIVLNNKDTGKHPFHLHGHNFQVVYRSDEDAGLYDASALDNADFPDVPMRRDTILAPPGGNVVVRFRADNPGIWFYHCHLVLIPPPPPSPFPPVLTSTLRNGILPPVSPRCLLRPLCSCKQTRRYPQTIWRRAKRRICRLLAMPPGILWTTLILPAQTLAPTRCPPASPPGASSRWFSAVLRRSWEPLSSCGMVCKMYRRSRRNHRRRQTELSRRPRSCRVPYLFSFFFFFS